MSQKDQQDRQLKKITFWVGWGLLFFVTGLAATILIGNINNDESYFLWIVNRMVGGEAIYRDFYFTATPLSVYLTAIPVKILGTHLVILKVGMSMIFAGIGILAIRMGQQLKLGRYFPLFLFMTMMAYAPPWFMGSAMPSMPLSYLFLSGSFVLVLDWREVLRTDPENQRKKVILLILVGIAAGLSFATKQSTGMFTLVGALVAITIINFEFRLSIRILAWYGLLIIGMFILVDFLIVLLPVMMSGGGAELVESTYLNINNLEILKGGRPYSTQLTGIFNLAQRATTVANLSELYLQLQILLPLFTFPVLILAWITAKAGRRSQIAVIFVFSAAAFLNAFSSTLFPSLSCAIPALLAGLVFGWRGLFGLSYDRKKLESSEHRQANKFWRTVAGGLVILWLGLGVILSLWLPVSGLATGVYRFSNLPHFKGIVVPSYQSWEDGKNASRLTKLVNSQPVFIINPRAGYYYFLSGLENPTRYDYPLETVFGDHGEEEVIDFIKRNQLRYVCLAPLESYYLKPAILGDYVQQNMNDIRDLDFCTIYKTRNE